MTQENNQEQPNEKEGITAKAAREARESLAKMFGNVDDNSTLIVILKDMSGRAPMHVHIQGPFKDLELYYGMLERAKDVARLSFQKKDN